MAAVNSAGPPARAAGPFVQQRLRLYQQHARSWDLALELINFSSRAVAANEAAPERDASSIRLITIAAAS
jgi:hypothetical protein